MTISRMMTRTTSATPRRCRRQVTEANRTTRALEKELEKVQQLYNELRDKAKQARKLDNAKGWFWEGDDVLGTLGIEDTTSGKNNKSTHTTGFPSRLKDPLADDYGPYSRSRAQAKVSSQQPDNDGSRAYLYVHDAVEDFSDDSDFVDEDKNKNQDAYGHGPVEPKPDYMRNTFSSKTHRVLRKKERRQGQSLEGSQYGKGFDAKWKLGLRPSVNIARPKKAQGKVRMWLFGS